MIARLKTEPVADQLELGHLGVGERRRAGAEHRARVAHRPVEHPREQLIAEVVVGGDVATPAAAGAAPHDGAGALERDADGRDQRAQPVETGRVARRQANERGQVRGIPQPLGIRLGESAAPRQRHPPHPRRADLDRRRRRPRAVHAALAGFDHGERSGRDPRQQQRQQPPRDPVDHAAPG
jgi:hypothetical protein